jgi:hypothetical protein
MNAWRYVWLAGDNRVMTGAQPYATVTIASPGSCDVILAMLRTGQPNQGTRQAQHPGRLADAA